MYACAPGQAGQVNVIEVVRRPDGLYQPRVRNIKLEGEEGRVREVTKYSQRAAGKTTIFSEAQLRIKNIAIETAIEGEKSLYQ